MIVTFRPDLSIDECLAALDEPSEGELKFGGRQAHPLPLGRNGIKWILTKKGIGPGDEVAVPALLSETVGEAVVSTGARLVTFGSCLPDFSPSYEDLARSITPNVKAVVVPHLYGVPADLQAFATIAKIHGLLLIEDCAHLVSQDAGAHGEGATGDCCIYSFHSGKPLSVDWGGSITLSPETVAAFGIPTYPAMSEDQDRLLAASFVAQRLIEDPTDLAHKHVSSTWAMARFATLHAAGGLQIDEFLTACMERRPVPELAALCRSLLDRPRTNMASKFPPRMKRAIKKVIPQRVQTAVTGVRDSSILGDLDGKIFRPDGFAARIISAQYRDFVQGDHTTRRRHLASIYASELDRDKFYFPQSPDAVVHWLVFPVVMKNRHRHDDLEYESAEKLQVDIAPWMWPLALQQYPHLRKSVRQGIGTREATEMVAGMFNLPVHSQMDERTARRLVAWLNSSADA